MKGKIILKDVSIQEIPLMTARDIKALRERLGMTQEVLALAMNLSIKTIQALEQPRRGYKAKGATLRLLQVFDEFPYLAWK